MADTHKVAWNKAPCNALPAAEDELCNGSGKKLARSGLSLRQVLYRRLRTAGIHRDSGTAGHVHEEFEEILISAFR